MFGQQFALGWRAWTRKGRLHAPEASGPAFQNILGNMFAGRLKPHMPDGRIATIRDFLYAHYAMEGMAVERL